MIVVSAGTPVPYPAYFQVHGDGFTSDDSSDYESAYDTLGQRVQSPDEERIGFGLVVGAPCVVWRVKPRCVTFLFPPHVLIASDLALDP